MIRYSRPSEWRHYSRKVALTDSFPYAADTDKSATIRSAIWWQQTRCWKTSATEKNSLQPVHRLNGKEVDVGEGEQDCHSPRGFVGIAEKGRAEDSGARPGAEEVDKYLSFQHVRLRNDEKQERIFARCGDEKAEREESKSDGPPHGSGEQEI